MLLAPADDVREIQQPADDPIHPVEDQNVELAEAVGQPVPELGTVERGGSRGHVEILGDADHLVSALSAQLAAALPTAAQGTL